MKQFVFGILLAGVAMAQTTIGLPVQPVELFKGGQAEYYKPIRAGDYGAFPDDGKDDTTGLNAALAAAAAQYRRLDLAGGTYNISDSLLLRSSAEIIPPGGGTAGLSVLGAGMGVTHILTDTTGVGFAVFRNADQKTCQTSGAGLCDVRRGTAGRGVGCECYVNGDCQSNSCTGGVAQRKVSVAQLSIGLNKDNMVGIDMAGISEFTVYEVEIGTRNFTRTNLRGVYATDSNITGYDNSIENSWIHDLDVCVELGTQANAFLMTGNTIGGGCGSGVVQDQSSIGLSFAGNVLQSTKIPTCNVTCQGGYYHGQTCAVAADCREGDLLVFGSGISATGNYFEDVNATHIRLGCSAQGTGPCTAAKAPGSGTSIGPNYHSAAGGTGWVSLDWGNGLLPYGLYDPFSATDKVHSQAGSSWGNVAPVTCSVAVGALRYQDTTIHVACVCNPFVGTTVGGAAVVKTDTPAYCREDTGACGSATDCG